MGPANILVAAPAGDMWGGWRSEQEARDRLNSGPVDTPAAARSVLLEQSHKMIAVRTTRLRTSKCAPRIPMDIQLDCRACSRLAGKSGLDSDPASSSSAINAFQLVLHGAMQCAAGSQVTLHNPRDSQSTAFAGYGVTWGAADNPLRQTALMRPAVARARARRTS